MKNLGDIWQEGRLWKIQMPMGIQTTKTKREALLWADNAKNFTPNHGEL